MRSRATSDSGAALVLVLIIVTVLSLGLLAVVSLSTTSIRTTVALRNQAGDSYAADAAAQVLIDQIRRETFACDTVNTLSLNNFYPAAGSAPGASAAVRCTPDPDNGGSGGGQNSSPGSAILTLATGSEAGISINSSNNQSVKVRGGIFSNSTIFLAGNKSDLQNTATNSYVYAMGSCTSSGTSKIISNPAAVCNYSSQPQSATDRRAKDPATVAYHGASFDPPPAPTVVRTPPTCTTNQVYELQPGLYKDAGLLNALTNNALCSKSIFHLNPGRYYFNFQGGGAHKWTIADGWTVGGTATAPLNIASPPAMPGSCVAPATGSSTPSSGVQLIFGGDSRMDYTKNGTDNALVELCASDAPSGPPIALYGLKQAIGSGQFAVPGQSGCITATPYPAGGDSTHCAILQSYSDPNPGMTIQGTTYTPAAAIDLYLNNNTIQIFRWGLITRSFRLSSTGSTGSLSNPVIDVPANAPAPFNTPNLMYLDVFVCPGAGTCSTSGTVKLRAKVLVSPDSPHAVTVLSWSRPG
jgi:hypothetical protein